MSSPLAVLLLGHIGLLSEQQSVSACLWLCVALLGVLGYAKATAWTTSLWVRLASGVAIALLGVVLVLLKDLGALIIAKRRQTD